MHVETNDHHVFKILSQASAEPRPAEDLLRSLPVDEASLYALVARGLLQQTAGGYVLTADGEAALDELWDVVGPTATALRSRILRVLSNIAPLNTGVLARVLLAAEAEVEQQVRHLAGQGMLDLRDGTIRFTSAA